MIVFLMLVGSLFADTADAEGCPVDPIVLTTQFSVLEDPSRALTIEKVNEPDVADRFRPNIDGRTNFGMSRSAFWIRIKPMMPSDCSQDWLLAIAWPLLGNVDFFGPKTPIGKGSPRAHDTLTSVGTSIINIMCFVLPTCLLIAHPFS